ncbi:Cytochrome-cbb3 oxidase, subunit I [gamma proteobacterium HdN1]|nr:Cytochrome-cbb3 oxidase, subunit I [gamma proteobacterium HdN1]
MKFRYSYFEVIEKRLWLLGILIAIFVSFGGLAEIVPLFAAAHGVKAAEGVKPYTPLRLAGFETYVKSGCYTCHSQMIRHLGYETQRYGAASSAEESVFDRPMQWGSKRTGPDLARIGGKYSDIWQLEHLKNPRNLVPESNMPNYDWLIDMPINVANVQGAMRAHQKLGAPYTEEEIAKAPQALEGKSQMDALIAYLQGLGVDNVPVERRPQKESQL